MICTILRGETEALDALVRGFRPGVPLTDQFGRRIGTVLNVWREGNNLKAEVEGVPEDLERARREGAPFVLHLKDPLERSEDSS